MEDSFGKLKLFSYTRPADDSFFRDKLELSLIEFLNVFMIKYEVERLANNNELASITYEVCNNNVEKFLMKLFAFYSAKYKGLTFRAKLPHVVAQLPDNLKSLLPYQGDIKYQLINNEKRLIDYLTIASQPLVVHTVSQATETQRLFRRPENSLN